MEVPFVRDTYRGELPVNWYPAKDDEKKVIFWGAPGLQEFCALPGCGAVRAMYGFGANLFAIGQRGSDCAFFRIDSLGLVTELTTFHSYGGQVFIIDNGSQLMISEGGRGYVYTGAGFAAITDADFPGASSLTYQDGYGIFAVPNTRQFGLSALYDFTSYDALDFASKEGLPDNIVAVFEDHRELWLFGSKSIEVWQDTGGTFPFSRIEGVFIEDGLAAAASVAKLVDTKFYLSTRKQVMQIVSYQPVKISTEKVDRIIESWSRLDNVFAFTYYFNGHAFYQMTSPTEGKTLVYDVTTKCWHERASYPDQGRHRANCYTQYQDMHLIGDYLNGKIYKLTDAVYTDDEEEIISVLYGNELFGGRKRLELPMGILLDFDVGVGLVSGEDPQVMFDWSKDGCKTWSSERWASLGKIGEYKTAVIFRRLGRPFRVTFRIKVSDPVKRNILGVEWVE